MPESAASQPQCTPGATNDPTVSGFPGDAAEELLLEDMLQYRPGQVPLSDRKRRYAPRGHDRGQPPVTGEEAWNKINDMVEKYDKGLCESYREQIDTLLVFAGLFSAVVTAFAVESYQWLQDDPTEASAELLRQAVALLSILANHTSAQATPQRGPALPQSAIVRINICWFLALVLSLSAALVAITCKQWLREYERNVGESARRVLGLRYMKFDGLGYWHVGGFVTSVPLLLQGALALFIIGIADLLWHLHRAVAIAVTISGALTGTFYVVTALLPAFQYLYLSWPQRRSAFTTPQCPYKSPQAWIVLRLIQPVIDYAIQDRTFHSWDSWIKFDAHWFQRRESQEGPMANAFRTLHWVNSTQEESAFKNYQWVFLCVWEEIYSLFRDPNPLADAVFRYTTAQHGAEYPEIAFLLMELVLGDEWHLEKVLEYLSSTSLDINPPLELCLRIMRYDSIRSMSLSLEWIATNLSTITRKFDVRTLNEDLAFELLRALNSLDFNRMSHTRGNVSSLLVTTANLASVMPSDSAISPVLCAISLQWLRALGDNTWRAETAHKVLRIVLFGLPSGLDLLQCRGFSHITALAEFMVNEDPRLRHDRNVRSMLKKLGLSTLRRNRPNQGPRSLEDVPELSATVPRPEDVDPLTLLFAPLQTELRLPHVAPGDSAPIDTSRSIPLLPSNIDGEMRVVATKSNERDDHRIDRNIADRES